LGSAALTGLITYYYEFWMGEESAGKMKKYKEVKRGA